MVLVLSNIREDAAMSLSALFDTVSDPRAANASHRLSDVILVMIAAVMCGRKTATDIALFAELRREAYEAFSTRASEVGPQAGQWDNAPIMVETLDLRQQLAKLLDFDNYAEHSPSWTSILYWVSSARST